MFDVTVDRSSLIVDSRESLFVSGKVWVKISVSDFPESDWSDSPLSVIGSMGTAIFDYLAGGIGDMYFFEGPYFVRFSADPSDDSLVVVTGICNRPLLGSFEGEERVVAKVSVPLLEVIRVYQVALRMLLEWAYVGGEGEILSALSRMEQFPES